jgi:hypothetical protein
MLEGLRLQQHTSSACSLEKVFREQHAVEYQTLICILYNKGKGKGKAIPLQALTGPECSRRLRLPDFKTIGT